MQDIPSSELTEAHLQSSSKPSGFLLFPTGYQPTSKQGKERSSCENPECCPQVRKVVINENGVCRTITKLEAAVKQLVNQAASGDLGAMRQLSALAGSAEEERGTPLIRELDQEDQKVMENVLKRFNKIANGDGNESQ